MATNQSPARGSGPSRSDSINECPAPSQRPPEQVEGIRYHPDLVKQVEELLGVRFSRARSPSPSHAQSPGIPPAPTGNSSEHQDHQDDRHVDEEQEEWAEWSGFSDQEGS